MKFLFFLILNLGMISCTFADGDHQSDHGHKNMDMDDMDKNAHWMAPEKASMRKNPIKISKESVTRGITLYKKNCASCHGAQAKGDGAAGKMLKPKPADLTKMAGNHPDGGFAWKIANGRGAMPTWKSILTENQIWDLVNYIQSLSSKTGEPKKESDHGEHSH